jgi:hypothetical protein
MIASKVTSVQVKAQHKPSRNSMSKVERALSRSAKTTCEALENQDQAVTQLI